MYKKLHFILMMFGLCIILTACAPSSEKVVQAQQKYAELVEKHNQVVEAHQKVDDDSLDKPLTELREKITEIENYNLSEMKDEEIDVLIQVMDDLIISYEDYLVTLSSIKGEEEAAVLTPISVTVVNQTDISFKELNLYEAGDAGIHNNVLAGMGEFASGETLTGLIVKRDTEKTPWILELKDANDVDYKFELLVEAYDEEGVKLNLTYDAEQKEISLSL